jgi:hypothetical protein
MVSFRKRWFVGTWSLVLGLLLAASVEGASRGGTVSVRGYFRKDGTYVQPHTRTAPDDNKYNNYSFPGNYNPNTGKISGGDPDKYQQNQYNRVTGTSGAISQVPSTFDAPQSTNVPLNLPRNQTLATEKAPGQLTPLESLFSIPSRPTSPKTSYSSDHEALADLFR